MADWSLFVFENGLSGNTCSKWSPAPFERVVLARHDAALLAAAAAVVVVQQRQQQRQQLLCDHVVDVAFAAVTDDAIIVASVIVVAAAPATASEETRPGRLRGPYGGLGRARQKMPCEVNRRP